tara:strand:- start:399 stop:626 length:228 start_codon:yes stop_codon:yes gene_type:complete
MKEFFYVVVLFLILSGCSLNPNSEFWNVEVINNNKSNEYNDTNEITNKILNNSYELMKQQIIDYGKKKDFPDISE